jgi:hypothetical protein
MPSLIPALHCAAIADLWPCHTFKGVSARGWRRVEGAHRFCWIRASDRIERRACPLPRYTCAPFSRQNGIDIRLQRRFAERPRSHLLESSS